MSWTLGVAVFALAVSLLLNVRFLETFAPKGDDPALVLHSARFFSPSPLGWVKDGYKGYNTSYPELGAEETNFVRPTVNASVYIDSWIAGSPTSAWMLATNYAEVVP